MVYTGYLAVDTSFCCISVIILSYIGRLCFSDIFCHFLFCQTMNKVFEHAGDLVNSKVVHSLMRLIAEGFGEDDAAADSQLRSSAVCLPCESTF